MRVACLCGLLGLGDYDLCRGGLRVLHEDYSAFLLQVFMLVFYVPRVNVCTSPDCRSCTATVVVFVKTQVQAQSTSHMGLPKRQVQIKWQGAH